MLITGLVLAASLATVPTAVSKETAGRVYSPAPALSDACKGGALMKTGDHAKAPQASRLSDQPKANFELTVNRRVNGCQAPAVVSYGVGK